jgi:cell division protein ZapA (FtsZ GTPase activity inhibitor)
VKQSVQVEIAGQTLSIRSDEGPDYVRELAEYVDTQYREMTAGKRSVSAPHRIALLLAMQIADELFREKDLNARFRARVEAQIDAIDDSLDRHESLLSDL